MTVLHYRREGRRRRGGRRVALSYRERGAAIRIDHLSVVIGRRSRRGQEHGRSNARAHAAGLDSIDSV